jgi:hypothetical protein
MAFVTIYDGIVISEGKLENARVFGTVSCDLSFRFGAQLKSHRDVKGDLTQQAKQMGANAIVDFKYGQKSRWLAIDDVAFFGNGTAVQIPQEDYQLYQNK